jgi:uncharacterized phage protein (TIGR02218 family)
MTYDARESSVEAGNPVELYLFAYGATTHRYTSSETSISSGGYTWNPENIKRTRIKKMSHSGSDKVQVQMPSSSAFAKVFKLVAPGHRVSCTIYRLHRDDGSVVTYYKGFTFSAGFNDHGRTSIFAILPITSVKNRQIPRDTFSGLCNNDLFDSQCAVNEATYTHNLNVTAVSGDVLTASGAGALGADYFENGFVVWNGEYRTIIRQSTNDITILVPFSTTPLGQTLGFRAGCKKRIAEDCHTKFSNKDNHGGFAFVPEKNIFETGLD